MIDVYKIGISIAVTNNASQVLGVLGRDLFRLGKQAEALTGQFSVMKLAAVGAMGAVAGAGVLTGMAKLVEHGKEFVHQQALMRAAGMDNADIAEATAAAWKNTQAVLGTSVSDNLKNLRELRMVFGDGKEGLDHLKSLTTAKMVVASHLGEGAADGQVFAMAKALELKGVSMDPAHFDHLVDAMTRAINASGGKVLGSDFLGAFKFGRTATTGWDDQFIGTILPTLVQEMKSGGGSGTGGPGNALQSAFQAVVGGVMSNKAANEFLRLGILDPLKVIRTSTGSVKGIGPGGVSGSAEFQADPYQWVQHVLVPALQKHGDNTPEKMREEIAHLFGNRTAQQVVTLFATQQQRFQKDATLIQGAQGIGAYNDLVKNDPNLQMQAFTASWQNLLTALGSPLVEPAYHMLDSLTAGINSLTVFAAAHPDAPRIILEITAGLGGLAVVLGTFAVGGAAISALVGVGSGMAALGAGLVTVPVSALVSTAGGLTAIGTALLPLGAALAPFAVGAAGIVALDVLTNRLHDLAGFANKAGFVPATGGPSEGAARSGGGPAGYNAQTRPKGLAPMPGDDDYHPTSYIPPHASGAPMIQVTAVTTLDGRVLTKTVSDHQAKFSSLPPAGGAAFDPRMTSFSPGQQIRI